MQGGTKLKVAKASVHGRRHAALGRWQVAGELGTNRQRLGNPTNQIHNPTKINQPGGHKKGINQPTQRGRKAMLAGKEG